MKIPDAEMPYTCAASDVEGDIRSGDLSSGTKLCLLSDYQKLFDSKCSPWISVEDGLPKNTCDCLIADPSGVGVALFNALGRAAFWTDDRELSRVTHWAPLPPPPKVP